MQESDDLNELLESIEKLEKLNVLSSDPLEPLAQNNQIMDELLKETLVANESPKSMKNAHSPSLSPNFSQNKSPSQFGTLKKEKEQKEEEKEEDFLENMIRNLDREENIHQLIPEKDKKLKQNNRILDDLDPETLLKEFEESEKKEHYIRERFDFVLNKCKNSPQQPLIILRKDKKYTSHEMVEEQLLYFQKIKDNPAHLVSKSNSLLVKATSDFDPSIIYTAEESKTMLKFKKGDILNIMAAFTSEWLLGYCKDSDVKIFPLMMSKPIVENFENGERNYEVNFWSKFGVYESKKEGKVCKSEKDEKHEKNEKAILEKEIAKDLVDHIFIDSPTKPILIYQAIKDFNFTMPEKFLYDKISLLSLRKGDLIAITKLPNQAGWAEGFALNKDGIKIGVFNTVFTTLIKFKLDEDDEE